MSKKIDIRSVSEIWKSSEALDESTAGRIPTFLGAFEHEGVSYDFDRDVLDGGMYRGMIIMSGFPGQGKTSTSVQMAVKQAIHNYRVLYISLEQDELEITEKVLGLLSGETFKIWEEVRFLQGKQREEKLKQGARYLDSFLEGRLKVTQTALSPNEIISLIDKEKENYDIIYVDNFQNITMTPGKEVEELRYASEQVKNIINGYGKCALVWLSQLTDKFSQDPLKANINYSSKLVHDVVLRMVVYNKEEKKDDTIDFDKTFIGVLKNRKSQKSLREVKKCVFTFDSVRGCLGSFILPSLTEKESRIKNDEEMMEVINELPKEMNDLLNELPDWEEEEQEEDIDIDLEGLDLW